MQHAPTHNNHHRESVRRLLQAISASLFIVGLIRPIFEMRVAFPFGSITRAPGLVRSLGEVWQAGHKAYALLLIATLLIIPLGRRIKGLMSCSTSSRTLDIVLQFDLTPLLVLAMAITAGSSKEFSLASGAYLFLASSIALTAAELLPLSAQKHWFVPPTDSPYAVPLLVSASLLLLASLVTPFLHVRVFGFFSGTKTLLGGITLLWSNGNYLISAALAASSIGLPILKLGVLAYFLSFGQVSRLLFRFVHRASPWSMLESAALFILLIHDIFEPGFDSAPGQGMWLFVLSVLTTTTIFSLVEYSTVTTSDESIPTNGTEVMQTDAQVGSSAEVVDEKPGPKINEGTQVASPSRWPHIKPSSSRLATWAGVILLGGVLCWIVAASSPLGGDPFRRLSTDGLLELMRNPVPRMGGDGDVAAFRVVKELKQRGLAPGATQIDRQRIEDELLAALKSDHKHSEYTKDLCILVLANAFGMHSAEFVDVLNARIDRLRRECRRGQEATVQYHIYTSQEVLARIGSPRR